MPDDYYAQLLAGYRRRRDVFLPYLEQAGLKFHPPGGAYYVMCDFTALGFADDRAFLDHLLAEVGVAGVPGSSFHDPAAEGRHLLRFMFAKQEDTLHEAGQRLLKLRERQR